jgi:hypothetical protein
MDQKSQENLEAKLKEIRESDEFTKLTPEEQKQKLQQVKDEARLTFGDFSKTEKYNPSQEKSQQNQELQKLEYSLGTSPDAKSDQENLPADVEKLNQSNQKFLQLLEAAHQNILKQTPIHFPTISLDSAGRATPALARMTRLTDYNNSTQDFDKIKQRFDQNSDPKKMAELISQPLILRLDIHLGGESSAQEYLQDLSLELSLQGIHDQLQKGHRLTEILSAFTDLVLSAAAEHSQKNSISAPEEVKQTPSSNNQSAFRKISKNSSADLNSMAGAFSQDSLSTVTFNSTSGQIWGEMDLNQIVATHQAPAESTDQISKEK